jgi:DNA-binding transcriptional ArsR family regulator
VTDPAKTSEHGRQRRVLDASALQGLAHPLRVQLYDALTVHGPATASDLARRFGESSGATSYHLRQLERHGFVEEAPGRGNRRERWWRAVRENTVLRSADFADDPALATAHELVANEWQRNRRARHDAWLGHRRDWPQQWRDVAAESTSHLGLTVEEAAQLGTELQEVLVRWADRIGDRDDAELGDGVQMVEVQVNVFPNGEPPVSEPAPAGTAAPSADPRPG